MEYEQIMMIHQKTGDKKYAKFLSDEGWKYDTETDDQGRAENPPHLGGILERAANGG